MSFKEKTTELMEKYSGSPAIRGIIMASASIHPASAVLGSIFDIYVTDKAGKIKEK